MTAAAGRWQNDAALTPARALLYKLPLSFGLALGLLLARPAAAEKTDHGAILPAGAREVGQDRFRSPEDYEATLKFYGKTYSQDRFPRRRIADLPGVRAVHIANPSRRDGWEGLNVYELNGETRIFVLARSRPVRREGRHH